MAQDHPTHRRHIELSLSWKLIVAFSLVFSVVFALAFWWFYDFSTKTALDQITQDMTTTLTATIDGIDGDQFDALVKNAKPDKPACQRTIRAIRHTRRGSKTSTTSSRGQTPTPTSKSPQDREVLWVGDIFRKIHPEDATKFLEPYTPSQDFMLMGLSEVAFRLKPYSDKWGTWISAYGPIKNSQGEFVGAVGIDFAADYVSQVQSAIRSRIVLAFLFTYGSLLVLVFLLCAFSDSPYCQADADGQVRCRRRLRPGLFNHGSEIWSAAR